MKFTFLEVRYSTSTFEIRALKRILKLNIVACKSYTHYALPPPRPPLFRILIVYPHTTEINEKHFITAV